MKNRNVRGFLMAVAMMGAVALPIKPAYPIVGAATGGAFLVFMGVAMAFLCEPLAHDTFPNGNLTPQGWFTLGILLMDGKNGQELQFAPVTDSQAMTLGLTQQEHDAYNSELDQINLVRDEASSAQSAEEAKSIWLAHKGDLSADASSAAGKIARAALSN